MIPLFCCSLRLSRVFGYFGMQDKFPCQNEIMFPRHTKKNLTGYLNAIVISSTNENLEAFTIIVMQLLNISA